ncbi:hypothetical protein G5T42_04925 [Microbacterium sp. 4R-513]|uniref:hypothetical protein n=1 Tax=Microbacterium sp. 4R-513 TaxID=2567934 RepID=UPI0013E11CAC|nr:hypothetical protein [Microbacterium sp. 4R-513]QIG38908.1 hypothetical protein G5T42_04925 [Microbacterium sp. 4R-513]
MDPLWAMIAELWWIVPVTTGAGVIAMLGMRHQRTIDARRLEYDAARLELHDARAHAWSTRGALKLARAELEHVQAERAAARASGSDVAAARRRLAVAQREVRAAATEVRMRRVRVSAARAGLAATTDPEHRPLARVMAAHDDITQRWLAYETDPARRIVFPGMSDGRVPATAAYLTARAEAQRLRPPSSQTRMTPVQYVAYRNAVDELARTFEAAERLAWQEARAAGMVAPEPRPEPAVVWAAAAQQFIDRSSAAIAWASDNAPSIVAMAQRLNDMTAPRTAKAPSAASSQRTDAPPPPQRTPPPPARDSRQPVWPVPARGSQRSAS